MSAVAIIPARGGSKRLPRKNLYPVLGVPMIAWAIQACRRARHVTGVYVSTEDAEIARVAEAQGATVIPRPPELATDEVQKQDAIVHATQALLANRDYVSPDDVQAVLPQTIAHRLTPVGDAGRGAVEQVRAMMAAVPLP